MLFMHGLNGHRDIAFMTNSLLAREDNGSAPAEAASTDAMVHSVPHKVRVLLVEDQTDLLQSAMNLLGHLPEIEVAGVARSGAEAIRDTEELKPDLVLMDASLPQMNGFDATQHIKHHVPNPPRIIVLTLFHGLGYEFTAQAAGADGLLAKPELGAKLPGMVSSLFQSTATA